MWRLGLGYRVGVWNVCFGTECLRAGSGFELFQCNGPGEISGLRLKSQSSDGKLEGRTCARV